MITFKHTGNFNFTERLFKYPSSTRAQSILEAFARRGVVELATATPKDTGETANSWDYEVKKTKSGYSIKWTNSAESEGIPIVILLQYGHGTRGGAYVEGNDFINPVIRPILDEISKNLWEEVTKL